MNENIKTIGKELNDKIFCFSYNILKTIECLEDRNVKQL